MSRICRCDLKQSSAYEEEPYRVQRASNYHEDNSRDRQEKPRHDMGQIQPMHDDAQVSYRFPENVTAKHYDGYQHSTALHENSTHNGTSPMPNVSRQYRFSCSQKLISRCLGSRSHILLTKREHR